MENKQTWRLDNIWNLALDQKEEREVQARDRLYASELGRSDVDIWLKLMGEPPTNPPNSRSKRKFEAGNIWEWIVRLVLLRSGILVGSQTPVKSTMENCLEVSGRLDYIAGGVPDYDKAEKELVLLNELVELPEMIYRGTEKIIEYFKQNFPNGMSEKIIEIKSCSSFAMERVEATEKAMPGHDLQLFHYAHNLQMEGAVCYICKDDCRMFECPILPNDERLLAKYKEKVERVSKSYQDKIMPDPEPLYLFDEEMFRFSKNFNVEYSPFLHKLYGFERPDLYDEEVSPKIGRWNRVLGRIKEKKDMTKNNLEALDEMKADGIDISKFVQAPVVTS